MKEFNDKEGRIAVLISQMQADKLTDVVPFKRATELRKELCDILSPMPFGVKRKAYSSLQADVHETVRRNLEAKAKKKPRRR